jgi:hypothetical protein
MPLVASRLRDDRDLCPGAFAIFRAVRIAQHVELAHGVYAQQLLADAARLHVIFGRTEFNAIQQKQILLRTVSSYREVIARGRVRDADSTRLLPSEIDHARIQREQFIVTAPVERKIPDLAFIHQARDILRGHVDQRGVGIYSDLLAGFSHAQGKVDRGILSDYQMDSGAHFHRESWFGRADLVFALGERRNPV